MSALVTRRSFLSTGLAIGATRTAVAAPICGSLTEMQPVLTPDERIAAAIEQIKHAIFEKYPAGNCRICRMGVDSPFETLMVVSNLSFLQPGVIEYHVDGKVVRREGGAS